MDVAIKNEVCCGQNLMNDDKWVTVMFGGFLVSDDMFLMESLLSY